MKQIKQFVIIVLFFNELDVKNGLYYYYFLIS